MQPKNKIQSPALLTLSLAASLALATSLSLPLGAGTGAPPDKQHVETILPTDPNAAVPGDTAGTLSGEYSFALEEIEDENGVTTIVVTISDAVAEPLPASDTEKFRRELEATLISLLWENPPAREAQPPSPPGEQYASNGVFPDLPRSLLPEPATLALLGLGLACIFLARCRFSG